MPVMSMLLSSGQTWGDYSVRLRRAKGGLGNAALRASGTPEQQEKWKGLTLAMAITEPAAARIRRRCRPRPCSTATSG
jgi:alkylation response protein AidB-like acyl-CoA dehydrogenase